MLLRGECISQIPVKLVPVDLIAVIGEVAFQICILSLHDRDPGVLILVKDLILHFPDRLPVHIAAVYIGSLEESPVDALTVIPVSVVSDCSKQGADCKHDCKRDPYILISRILFSGAFSASAKIYHIR